MSSQESSPKEANLEISYTRLSPSPDPNGKGPSHAHCLPPWPFNLPHGILPHHPFPLQGLRSHPRRSTRALGVEGHPPLYPRQRHQRALPSRLDQSRGR